MVGIGLSAGAVTHITAAINRGGGGGFGI